MKSNNNTTSGLKYADSVFDKVKMTAGNSMFGVIKKRKTKTLDYEQVFVIDSRIGPQTSSIQNMSTAKSSIPHQNDREKHCVRFSPTFKKDNNQTNLPILNINLSQPTINEQSKLKTTRTRMLTIQELLN